MKKIVNKIIIGAASFLLLAACTNSPTSTEPPLPPLEEDELAEIVKELEVKAHDNGDILGNIYLPEYVQGATITWSSDHPDVISDVEMDGKAPGVVTRLEDGDVTVTLTAKIEKDGKRSYYDQEVNVRQLKTITEDMYCGYLLVTFTGEGSSDGEQVYMSLAGEGEGFNFKPMNGNKAVLESKASEMGVRDPFVYRSPEGDRFFIIGTDLKVNNRPAGGWRNTPHGYTYPTVNGSHSLILWSTTDLTDWGEATYIEVAPENAGMAWAPEMVWNEETGEYVVFFSSCIIDDLSKPDDDKIKVKGDAVYRVTTRDFVHFSEPQLFIDNQPNDTLGQNGEITYRNIIDATVRKIGDYYYSITKDGDNGDREGGILIMRSDDILDIERWEKVCDLDELGLPTSGQRVNSYTNQTLEGPELFPFNQCDWKDPNVPEYCVMGDQYQSGAGYLPFATTDIEDFDNSNESWRVLSSSEYSFQSGGKRHGSVLQLTLEEVEALQAKYM